MLNGYVGIVSRRGLCQLQVERNDAIRRASQATRLRCKFPCVGFWAVLADETARNVRRLLQEGRSREALYALNQGVVEGGHLLPLKQ